MTNEMRKMPPQTIKDLYYKNYTIVAISDIVNGEDNNGFVSFLNLIESNERPNIITFPLEECTIFFYENYRNDSLKYAFLLEDHVIRKSNKKLRSSLLKETFMTVTSALGLNKNSFIFELFAESFEFLIAYGIPQQILKFHNEHLYPPKEEEPQGPQVLNFLDLSYGFIIWLTACGVSTVIFLLEIIPKLVLKFLKFLKLKIVQIISMIMLLIFIKKRVIL